MSRHFDRPCAGRSALSGAVRQMPLRFATGFFLAISVLTGPNARALESGVTALSSSSEPRLASPAPTRRAPATMELVVAATTDQHGWLRGWDYFANRADLTRGMARVATVLDSVRAANPARVILLDAGDMLQGNPLDYVAAKVAPAKIHPVIATMNLLRYDAAVVGNHEFDYGVPFLDAAIKGAKFPFLASNVKRSDGTGHFKASTTLVRGGVRVAVIGATTTGSRAWNAEQLRVAGLTVTDAIPELRSEVKAARAAGAQVVIVLLHSGLGGRPAAGGETQDVTDENVAGRVPHEVEGVDLVVFGHTHNQVVDSTVNGVMVMQPRQWAGAVGVATLKLEQASGKWRVVSARGSSVSSAGHAESKAVLALSKPVHDAAVRWVNAPVGTTAVRWSSDSARVKDSPITDFVAEVMRRETKSDLAAVAAFTIRARLDSGAITVARISELYPYDNTLRAVQINGKQLRAFLEHSALYYRTLGADGRAPVSGIVDSRVPGFNFDIVTGAEYTIDLQRPAGQRVTSLSFRNKPVADGDSFTMATNNYRLGGGGGYSMMPSLPVTYSKEIEIRQLLIDEVKRVGTLRPADYFKQNWKLEPSAVVAMAYAEQNAAQAAAAPNVSQPQPGTRTLRVISTSDFHAALEGRRDERGVMRGGAVALQSALTRARRECTGSCTSVTIDAGDLFAGSPASDWTAGKPTIAAMNRMGISAGALGNHEFDFGQDTLRMRLRELKYRVLAANVVGTDGKIPSWLKADTIVVRNGVRIGIIGAASQFTPGSTKSRFIKGLKFLDAAPIVSERIKALRAQNVDAVVVTIHEGGRCTSGVSEGCTGSGMDFVRKLTEKPDAVILGHAHTNVLLNINGIPSVQVWSNGRSIGVIDIPLNNRSATVAKIRDVIGDSLPVDPVLDTIVKNAVRRVATRIEQPVATIKENLERNGEQYPLGNLISDALRVMGNGDFGAWNNGGIRADLLAGPLNYGGVHEVTPFGNSLAKLTMRGRDLKTLAEGFVRGRDPDTHVSGLLVEFDGSKPSGQRITSFKTSAGQDIDPARVYTIVVNDYMLDEIQGRSPELLVSAEVLPMVDAPTIAEYLKRQPQPVVAPPEVRIKRSGGSR